MGMPWPNLRERRPRGHSDAGPRPGHGAVGGPARIPVHHEVFVTKLRDPRGGSTAHLRDKPAAQAANFATKTARPRFLNYLTNSNKVLTPLAGRCELR